MGYVFQDDNNTLIKVSARGETYWFKKVELYIGFKFILNFTLDFNLWPLKTEVNIYLKIACCQKYHTNTKHLHLHEN